MIQFLAIIFENIFHGSWMTLKAKYVSMPSILAWRSSPEDGRVAFLLSPHLLDSGIHKSFLSWPPEFPITSLDLIQGNTIGEFFKIKSEIPKQNIHAISNN